MTTKSKTTSKTARAAQAHFRHAKTKMAARAARIPALDRNGDATHTPAYAVTSATDSLKPFTIERRHVGLHDIKIDILYCGICHTDLHQTRNDWGGSIYPMVPGHEIVGRVAQVGAKVKHFKVGELAGVGCFVNSCRACPQCKEGLEQYCAQGATFTYSSYERDGKTPTFGGYSTNIVVDENYALHISKKLPLDAVAPLLCAGITTYSPLRHWRIGKAHKVGIVGLGGLGHMAVKIAAALGAEVTLFSTSANKEKDARKFGAKHFALTSKPGTFEKMANTLDFILDTVSAPHDYDSYLKTLKTNGVMVCVGVPTTSITAHPMVMVSQRRTIAGSMIGGITETQDMLDFCAKHNIVSDVEVIPIQKVNEAYARLEKNDVKYRFVIDMASLRKSV